MNGPRWRALPAALIVAATLALTGCTLILDFSELSDAGVGDDATGTCNAFEPNDTRGEGALLEDTGATAAICLATPPDLDFFRFSTPGGLDTVLRLSMDDGTGPRNLNIRVYADGNDTAIGESTTETNEDVVEFTLAGANQLAAGDYDVEVFGVAQGNINEYTLALELTTP